MAVTTGADSGATFSLEEEDHTLANSLRFLLNKKCVDQRHSYVWFVGHRCEGFYLHIPETRHCMHVAADSQLMQSVCLGAARMCRS